METYAKTLPSRKFKSTRDMRKAMEGVKEHIDVKEAKSHEDLLKESDGAKWDMSDPVKGKEIFERYKQHGRIGVVNVKTGGLKKRNAKWLYYTPNKDAPEGFNKKMVLNAANEPKKKTFQSVIKYWAMPALAGIFTTAAIAAPNVAGLMRAAGGIPSADIAAGLAKVANFAAASSGPVMAGLIGAGVAGIATGFLVNAIWHGMDRRMQRRAKKFLAKDEVDKKGKKTRTKLSPKQVMKIRKQHKAGTKSSKLAKQYNVSPTTIQHAIKGVGAYRNLASLNRRDRLKQLRRYRQKIKELKKDSGGHLDAKDPRLLVIQRQVNKLVDKRR